MLLNRSIARKAAWLPAALLVSWAILAATGFPLTPNSQAASASSTTSVTASVLPEVHMDLANADPDGAGPLSGCGTVTGTAPNEDGAFTPTAMSTSDGDIELARCTMTFGSNNNGTSGATLSVESTRASGAAFCSTAFDVACAGNTFADENGDATLAEGGFGLRPTTVSGCGGAGADWSTANYYGIPADLAGFGTQICDTNNTSDGTMVLTFRANPSASQTAGNYYVRARFTAQAL